MRVRNLLVLAIGAVVLVGGVYLWLDVRGSDAAQPSPAKVAEAQARHARAGGAGLELERGDRVRTRPPRADAFTGDAIRPPGAGLPQIRKDIPGLDSKAFLPSPALDAPDKLQPLGAVQPAIDPDDPELTSAMTESNKMYDRGDFEGARNLAFKVLERDGKSVRMMRVVVSASCILGDSEVATKYWAQLPEQDQAQMSIRCARYQVSFPTEGAAPAKEK